MAKKALFCLLATYSRSASKYLLSVPFTTFTDMSFSMAGPIKWNALPESVKLKDSNTVETEIENFSL